MSLEAIVLITNKFVAFHPGGPIDPRGQRVRCHRQTGPAGRAIRAVTRAGRRRGPRLPLPHERRSKRAPPNAFWRPEGKAQCEK